MQYGLNVLAEQRMAELRADAELRRYAVAHRVPRNRVRSAVGYALVRVGQRLAAAPTRTAATP